MLPHANFLALRRNRKPQKLSDVLKTPPPTKTRFPIIPFLPFFLLPILIIWKIRSSAAPAAASHCFSSRMTKLLWQLKKGQVEFPSLPHFSILMLKMCPTNAVSDPGTFSVSIIMVLCISIHPNKGKSDCVA